MANPLHMLAFSRLRNAERSPKGKRASADARTGHMTAELASHAAQEARTDRWLDSQCFKSRRSASQVRAEPSMRIARLPTGRITPESQD